MPSASSIALDHQDRLIRINATATNRALTLWRRIDFDALDASWAAIAPEMVQQSDLAQLAAAKTSDRYTSALSSEYDFEQDSGRIIPQSFVGVDGSGRPMGSLLHGAVTTTKEAVGAGLSRIQSLEAGGVFLAAMLKTGLADIGRSADMVSATGKGYTRYVRVVNPGACSRCAQLAGIGSYRTAFKRHPACFPAGVTVSGPALNAATRRWYEGELVTFSTTGGQDLSLTANHPVLTRRGWVPANLLVEGDEVFRSTEPQGTTALEVPNHNQMPARVEDVWSSLSVGGFVGVPSTTEDFHGDGQDGQVDIVLANGALGDHTETAHSEYVNEFELGRRLIARFRLDRESVAKLLDLWDLAHSAGFVGGGSVSLPVFGARLGSPSARSFAFRAGLDSSAFETHADHLTGNPVLGSESVFTSARLVGGGNGIDGKLQASRWDAPAESLSVDNAGRYASQGSDLLKRLSGKVETDRIVSVRRVSFAGHVYSLESVEGWHAANTYIVSNCKCTTAPVVGDSAVPAGLHESPEDYFESLAESEQDRIFTKGGAEAIRSGANVSDVVSARRGASGITTSRGIGRGTAPNSGRRIQRTRIGTQADGSPVMGYTTTEGTYRGRFKRDQQRYGVGSQRIGDTRYSATKRARLMPETIVGLTDDLPTRQLLLRDAGYLDYRVSDYSSNTWIQRQQAARIADRAAADTFYRSHGIQLG